MIIVESIRTRGLAPVRFPLGVVRREGREEEPDDRDDHEHGEAEVDDAEAAVAVGPSRPLHQQGEEELRHEDGELEEQIGDVGLLGEDLRERGVDGRVEEAVAQARDHAHDRAEGRAADVDDSDEGHRQQAGSDDGAHPARDAVGDRAGEGIGQKPADHHPCDRAGDAFGVRAPLVGQSGFELGLREEREAEDEV